MSQTNEGGTESVVYILWYVYYRTDVEAERLLKKSC